jgi:hypothetical protein
MMTDLPLEGDHAVFAVVDDSVSDEIQSERQRNKRNRLLADSDWTQAADNPTGNASNWATYRQHLRDLPSSPNWPHVDFPEAPT